MSGDRLFKPSEKGIRAPTSNTKDNGQFVNPPRFPEMGGFSTSRKGIKKDEFKVVPPK